jgi:hypothetical protein
MAANMTNDLYFFFIEIENFRGEGKILMRHTHDTTFSEKILDFSKILEESEQFFILFLKKMENIMRFFSIFEVRGGNSFFKFTFSEKWSELSKELKLIIMWPKHTNIF